MARIVVVNNSHRYFYLWLTKNLWADVSQNSRYTGTTMSRKALRGQILRNPSLIPFMELPLGMGYNGTGVANKRLR